MCSIGDEFEDRLPSTSNHMETPVAAAVKSTNECIKCRAKKTDIVLQKKYSYCKECFLTSTGHKFKSLLGKMRLIKAGEDVLVSYVPGIPTTALLHFLRRGLDLTTPKKLRFNPIVVYLEANSDLNGTERKDFLRQINEEVASFRFPIFFVSLVEFIKNETSIANNLTRDYNNLHIENDDKLFMQQHLKEKSPTDSIRILDIYSRNLLIETAKCLQCKTVFSTDIAVDTASQLLTNVAFGRGAYIPYDTGVVDTRESDVKIIRPLRLYSMEELENYNRYNDLSSVQLNEDTSKQCTVQNVIRKFITELQENFPATISTVIKTGDKLALAGQNRENGRCKICHVPLATITSKSELNAKDAINFSDKISKLELSSAAIIDTTENACFSCSQIFL